MVSPKIELVSELSTLAPIESTTADPKEARIRIAESGVKDAVPLSSEARVLHTPSTMKLFRLMGPVTTPRPAALDRGLRFYQGKPCRHGHDGLRYGANGGCVECVKATAIRTKRVKKAAPSEF